MPVARPTPRKPPRLKKKTPQVTRAPKAPKKGVVRKPKAPAKGVARTPTMPTGAAGPVAPAAPAPPPAAGGPAPPPESVRGAQTRSGALSAYSTAVSGFKSQLVQAALALGSPEILQALLANPDYAEYAGVINQGMVNPQSTMSQLKTQEEGDLKDVDTTRNASNTFFSGFRLQDRGKVTDDYTGRRSQAVNDYVLGPQAEATRGIGDALADYNRALDEALGYDIEAQLAAEPEPEEAAPPAAPAKKPRLSNRSRSAAAASKAQAQAARRRQQQQAAAARRRRRR